MSLMIILASSVGFLLCLADLIVGLKKGAEQSLSWQIYSLSVRFPVIPLLVGILMGHFFWSQHGVK